MLLLLKLHSSMNYFLYAFQTSYVSTILLQNYKKPKAKVRQIYYLKQVTNASLIIRDDCLELHGWIWKGLMLLNLIDNTNFNFLIQG